MKQVISIGKYTGIKKVADFGETFDEYLWMKSHVEYMQKIGYQTTVIDAGDDKITDAVLLE